MHKHLIPLFQLHRFMQFHHHLLLLVLQSPLYRMGFRDIFSASKTKYSKDIMNSVKDRITPDMRQILEASFTESEVQGIGASLVKISSNPSLTF